MALPDFFVIGAAKAGTTSLYALLDRHPDIFMPKVKEPEFFARDDLYDARGGLEAYTSAYDAAAPGQVIGEASTLYSLAPFFGNTAARIYKHVPHAKLIYVLRQPVDRAYSYYQQLIKNYQNATHDYAVHRSFEDFVLSERHAHAAPREKVLSVYNAHLPDVPDLCLSGSDYMTQINAYLEYFDRTQILFLKFEDLVADRPAALAQVTDFLGVDPLPQTIFEEDGVTRNVSKKHFAVMGQEAKIQTLKRSLGPLSSLRALLPSWMKDSLRARVAHSTLVQVSHHPPPMELETQALLQARFAPQIDQLSEMCGLDLDSWRRPAR